MDRIKLSADFWDCDIRLGKFFVRHDSSDSELAKQFTNLHYFFSHRFKELKGFCFLCQTERFETSGEAHAQLDRPLPKSRNAQVDTVESIYNL